MYTQTGISGINNRSLPKINGNHAVLRMIVWDGIFCVGSWKRFVEISGGNMNRTGTAVWSGGLKDGKGSLSTESKTLSETLYSFTARFKEGGGTNPEELIAAAHAGCFTMDLSGRLGAAGVIPDEIRTMATLTMEKTDKGFSITGIHLDVSARIPGCDSNTFETAVKQAKEGCPVSRLLDADISVDARLNQE